MIAKAAFALAAATVFSGHAQASGRAATVIPCPQTIISPDAQRRIDAGEKPEIIKSWYRPGLINPRGFCTITLSPDGRRLLQFFNEATSIGQIPIRFEYGEFALFGYAGPKGLPLGAGNPDMTCYAPDKDKITANCSILLTSSGMMTLTRKEGDGTNESEVSIDPKQVFNVSLQSASKVNHYAPESGFNLFGPGRPGDTKYVQSTPTCPSGLWSNVATRIVVSTGGRNGNAFVASKSFNMESVESENATMPNSVPLTLPQFQLKGSAAASIIDSIMNSEAAEIKVETACEGTLQQAYLTELPRAMNHVYQIIKPRMLLQR
jgi:hypothetical protein